jgi:hypothetical protein
MSFLGQFASRSTNATDKFRVNDIVSMKIYPGRDVWEQVSQVVKSFPHHYEMRPIQSRTTTRDWSTESVQSHAYRLQKGGEEEQSSLFSGNTLEQTNAENEEKLRRVIRHVLREEMRAEMPNMIAKEATVRDLIRQIVREEMLEKNK